MQNFIKQIDYFSTQLNVFIYKITGVLILVQFGIVINGVFFRYILNNPLSWVLPISRIILVWTGLLGVSIAFKEGEHVALKGFVSNLPVTIQKIILFFGYILIIIFSVSGVRSSHLTFLLNVKCEDLTPMSFTKLKNASGLKCVSLLYQM